MESLSSFAKRFVAQVAKPDVDFVFGLSPVISIEQKTIANNPRSTVGTMTDIASYLNLLFATIGEPHCPRTGEPTPSRSSSQILEAILSLPEGTEIELRAPVFKVYGEELDFVFTEIRKKGCRRLIVDGKPVDISEPRSTLDERRRSTRHGRGRRPLRGRAGSTRRRSRRGSPRRCWSATACCRSTSSKGASKRGGRAVLQGAVQRDAPLRLRRYRARVLHVQQPRERLPDVRRPRRRQADASGAAGSRPEAEHPRRLLRPRGVQVQPGHLGRPGDVQPVAGARLRARLAVEGAAREGAQRDPLRHRLEEARSADAAGREGQTRRSGGQGGRLRRDRAADRAATTGATGSAAKRTRGWRHGSTRSWSSTPAPTATAPASAPTRLLFTIAGKTIHDVGQLNFDELHAFLGTVKPTGRGADAGRQVLKEIRGRLELLLGIGLDYLNFNRRSGTLSGGESQRIRLSTQIGSGLMGMLYVLDEPSIGLHPKDNVEDDRDAREPARHRQHGDRRGARRGHDPRRRSSRRDGSRPGRPRRRGRRAGDARGRARVQGVADGAVPLGQADDCDAETASARQRQGAGRARRAREQPQERST